MSQSTSILLVCPACKSRRQVPREMIGQRVRCRQCTAELTVDPPANDDDDFLLADEPKAAPAAAVRSPATSSPASSSTAAISVDDIPVPSYAGASSAPPVPPLSDAEYQVGPPPLPSPAIKGALPKPLPAAKPHDAVAKTPKKKTLGWTFLSGVFFFFLRRTAVSQWLILSVGVFVSTSLMGLSAYAAGAPYVGGAGAAGFAISGFLIGIGVYSYASACFLSIVENTAYHLDNDERWPDSEFREWLFHLVRIIYLGVIRSLLALPLGYVVSLHDPAVGGWVASIASDLLLPILLLSALEADAFLLPFSTSILRSLVDDWRAWLVYYVVSIAFTTALYFLLMAIHLHSPIFPPLIAAPLFAAAIFTYARLLGRLASYIMHLDDKNSTEPPKRTRPAPDFYPPGIE
jgi:hypothetical protein